MDLYRLNLNLLIALDNLLSEQSVTSAAKKLFITQAAMSNNLQQLRKIFKDDLLIREKHTMVLTGFAKELQPKLHQILQEVHSLVVSGQHFDPQSSNRCFKIGASDYMAALLLPKLTAKFENQAPNLKLSVVSLYHLNSLEPFEKGDFELGIGKASEAKGSLCKQLLFKDIGAMIINHKHPLAKKEKITLKDYLSHKHVAIRADSPHYHPVIEHALGKLGYRRDIQIGLPFIIPIFKLIEQSDSLIGTVLKCMTALYQKNYRYLVKPLPFKFPPIEFYLVWPRRYDNDQGHQWLRQQIISLFRS